MKEDEIPLLRPYGKYQARYFQMALCGRFSLQSTPTDAEVLEDIERAKKANPLWLPQFTEAMRQFFLDPYMSLSEKALVYLGGELAEEEAETYFRRCWQLVAPNEPWPLDPPKL